MFIYLVLIYIHVYIYIYPYLFYAYYIFSVIMFRILQNLEPKYQHKYVDGVNADEVPEHHTS